MSSEALPRKGEGAGAPSRVNRTIASIGVANVALYVVYMGALQLLLPHQLGLLDPANKVSLFGAITGVAALAATVANPIAGALSDRTRSSWGRRARDLGVFNISAAGPQVRSPLR
ncbi:MAG: hypothetical protein ABUS48_04060 [Pseudomonadota bacterium]